MSELKKNTSLKNTCLTCFESKTRVFRHGKKLKSWTLPTKRWTEGPLNQNPKMATVAISKSLGKDYLSSSQRYNRSKPSSSFQSYIIMAAEMTLPLLGSVRIGLLGNNGSDGF